MHRIIEHYCQVRSNADPFVSSGGGMHYINMRTNILNYFERDGICLLYSLLIYIGL